MPAKIVVLSGQQQGTEFWIEDEVVRIGSGADCAIHLSGAEAPVHTATLENRDGTFIIHNRSDQPLLVAGHTLDEREFAPWHPGSDLQLASRTILRLEMLEDAALPASPYAQDVEDDDLEDEAEPVAAVKPVKKKSNTGMQLLLIAIALGAVGFVLFYEPEETAVAGRNEPKVFAEQVVKLLEIEKGELKDTAETSLSAIQAHEFRRLLQKGRIAELRGDTDKAKKLYKLICDPILRLRNEGQELKKTESELLNFVIYQLKKAEE